MFRILRVDNKGDDRMGVLVDWQIRKWAREHGMIDPFVDYGQDDQRGKISYGLSSMGYDIRLGSKFKLAVQRPGAVLDPKAVDPAVFTDFESSVPFQLPPFCHVLGVSLERFRIPRHILCQVLGKSTLARVFLFSNVTPGEPEWAGYWTLELSNPSPLPIVLYPGEGIAQVLFHKADKPKRPCELSYADKHGKYQDQPAEVVTSRVMPAPAKTAKDREKDVLDHFHQVVTEDPNFRKSMNPRDVLTEINSIREATGLSVRDGIVFQGDRSLVRAELWADFDTGSV